jgi:hypothetical protein
VDGFRRVTSDVRCAGTGLDRGFQPVMIAMQGKWRKQRREGSHHWIARCGSNTPGGYRGSIGLEGGLRLRNSDPRIVRLSGGRGVSTPVSRSVTVMTQT